VLSDLERQNLDVIRDAEAGSKVVQPGDRAIASRHYTEKVGPAYRAEWTVLAAEIEAIHGKRFDDTPGCRLL
jgi:hypothetical protein